MGVGISETGEMICVSDHFSAEPSPTSLAECTFPSMAVCLHESARPKRKFASRSQSAGVVIGSSVDFARAREGVLADTERKVFATLLINAAPDLRSKLIW